MPLVVVRMRSVPKQVVWERREAKIKREGNRRMMQIHAHLRCIAMHVP